MIIINILLVLLIVVLLYILFLFICSLFIDTKKEYEKDSKFYRFLLNSATAIVLKFLRIKVNVKGKELVPKDTKVLFVSNHRSNYDPIISWYVFRDWKPAFVSKEANFHIPIFGRFIRKCCFMVIYRENPRNAIKTINKAAELLKRQEVSVGIYPEGTRSKKCVLLPFHNGVFKIAQKSQTSIVVLAIEGTEKIASNLKKLKSSQIELTVVDVIEAKDVSNMRTDAIGNRVREKLEETLERKDYE